jgi:hypothetical protein
MEDFGIFYGHLVYFVAIWYILWPFGIFYGYLVGICFSVLVCCTKENLATPYFRKSDAKKIIMYVAKKSTCRA